MIIGPWKVNVPLHVCMCTHVHIYAPPIFERDTVHINSVFVFQSPFKHNRPLTWLFHFPRFYCSLVWGGESSGNPQAGMQAPGLRGVSEKLPLDPTFQTSFTKNRFHYNLSPWTTEVKQAYIPKTMSYWFPSVSSQNCLEILLYTGVTG